MSHVTRKFRVTAAVAVAAVLAAGAAQAETLRYLMPWGATSEGNTVVGDLFMKIVEEESNGDITLQKFDNSVVPPFEQFEPVASGVFDIHYTSPAYHSGATVVGQIADTATSDIEARHSSGFWDMIDKAYQKRGVKLIALGKATGYQFLLRDPIGEDGGLEGRKIRSNPAYDGTIRALGGSPIQLPITEVYTALQKALIDGTAFPIHGVESAKMYEVVKYMARPTFGQGTVLVVMNLDKWNAETPEHQEMLFKAGRRFEDESFDALEGVAKRDQAAMEEHGTEVTELGDEYAQKIDQIYNEGIWDRALANGGDEAKELIDFLKENDLVYGQSE